MSRVARHPSRKRSRAIGVRIFLERELWESTRFHFPILTFKQALAGSLADEKSEAFEYPGIVAEIVAQEGEVLVVGRRDAPSFGEETWLTQKNRGVTAEVNIEERARQR